MIKFGPSGNSASFYNAGFRHTWQSMKWLREMGLDAYEYAGGKGLKIGPEACRTIRDEAEKHGISLSLHAPYYINLANEDAEKQQKSMAYIFDSLQVLRQMGGRRLVLHCGSYLKQSPARAFKKIKENMLLVLERMEEQGYNDILLCPETLGKLGQFGTVEEIVGLCKLSERLIPCIDFGHLYARSQGRVASFSDFMHILGEIEKGLGRERMEKIHIHFSRIEYTKAGEKMHHTFADTKWGPDFPPLAQALLRKSCRPVIICESRETMAEDALAMKNIYQNLLGAEK